MTPFDYNFDYAIKTTPLGTGGNSSNYISSSIYTSNTANSTASTDSNSSNFANHYYQINNPQIIQVSFFY